SPSNGVLSGSPPSVTYTPNGNFNGSDSFTFTTTDSILTSSPATVTITVNAVNDAPVNTVPGTQVINEDATLTFTGGTAISVTDPDVGGGSLSITLTSTNGTVTLGGTAGLTGLTGNGTATVTFGCTLANCNSALNNSVFTPTNNFNGAASVTINSNDNGNTG